MMKTPENAQCPEFLSNLERLMNGEMTKEEEQKFVEAIRPNISCVTKMELELAYKEFLAKKLERKCCTQSLINSIQEKCIKEEE